MLITICMYTLSFSLFFFFSRKISPTNENFIGSNYSLKIMIGGKYREKKRKLDDFLFYEFNNPFRRWINATPAEKSTSHIRHHHHSRRHLCLVECVNFKRRNKKLFFLIFSNLKKTHHHHLLCTSWSVVCLLAYISTYIYIYIYI